VHNLRGLRRTGFVAQYRSGIGLVDLFNNEPVGLTSGTNPNYYAQSTVGSFDTTVRVPGVNVAPPGYPTSAPPGYPQATQPHWTGATTVGLPVGYLAPGYYDRFLGSWDVFVQQDSGFVYGTLGPTNIQGSSGTEQWLTAGVFRVLQGHLNRYWDATTFPGTSPNAPTLGSVRHPKLVCLQGPPRAGKALLIGDENAGSYALFDGTGNALRYEYTLYYDVVAPVGVGGNNPATAFAPLRWDPDPTMSNNDIWLNVGNPAQSPPTPFKWTKTPSSPLDPSGSWFHFPSLAQGPAIYAQLVVREYAVIANVPTKTGHFAASRGTWFGIAP